MTQYECNSHLRIVSFSSICNDFLKCKSDQFPIAGVIFILGHLVLFYAIYKFHRKIGMEVLGNVAYTFWMQVKQITFPEASKIKLVMRGH